MLKLRRKFLLIFSIVFALAGLVSCTVDGSTSVKIRFEEQSISLLKGETYEIEPTIYKGEAVGVIDLVWSSDDTTVVEVVDGKITAVGVGKTQIKVALKDKPIVYDKVEIEVVETYLPTLNFTTETKEIKDNEQLQMTYELLGDAEGVTVEWSTSDEEVAVVDQDGLVTAKKAGNVTIIATLVSDREECAYEFELTIGYSEFEIKFELEGGKFGLTIDEFAEQIVALFNASDESGSKVLTKETFHVNSHPNIKGVFNKAENLEAYKWFFEFTIAELTANCAASGTSGHLAETVEMLERMINGDTTAIGGSYANGRSVFRHFIHNLINKDHESAGSTGGAYLPYTTDFSVEENQARFLAAMHGLPTSYQFGDELPVPTRVGYEFLGWYDGEELVETAQGAATLTAKWELAKYELTFELDGGKFGLTIDEFAEQIVALFNASDESGSKVLTKETFHVNSHPNIKGVFNKAENLEAYKWFFEFTIAELTANCAASGTSGHLAETVEMLERMINGDTTAIGGSYANGRSVFRHFIHNLINKDHESAGSTGGAYLPYTTDFSVEENQARFLAAMNGVKSVYEYGEELPTPTKEGYEFLGWYVGETKVEKVNGELVLTAKWQEIVVAPTKYNLVLNLNSGVLENIPTEYEVATGLVLPTPTREGYDFLGWFDNAELTGEAVTEIAAGSEGNKEFYAKWAEKTVEPPLEGEFEITYELNGGHWAQSDITSYEGFREAILADFEAYFSKLAGKEVTINRVSENTDPNKDNWHITDFMGVSYLYRDNIEAFFTTEEVYAAKWGWVFDQLKADGIEADAAWAGYRSTVLRGWTHGFIYQTKYDKWPKGNDYSNNTFDLIEGKITAKVEIPGPSMYDAKVGVKLDEAYKEDHKFAGWYTTPDFSGEALKEIKAGTTGNITLYAKFNKNGAELLVGADKQYKTIAEALEAANEGDIIVLDAGEYELAQVITKSVTIKGPNADCPAPAAEKPEALINVAKDIAGNLAAKNITFNGVHLKGTGGGGGIPGVFFQDGGNIESLTFKSCVVSDMNTFVKFVNEGSNLDLVLEDCHFYMIGQFIVWTTKSINKTILLGNVVDGNTCGAVTNAAAALFRIRTGSLEAYNNVFNGDSANTPGYFECSAEQSIVKYNVFNGVRLFAHPTANNNIVFDENMYYSISGSVLEAAPADLKAGGTIVADKTVCTTAEELQNAYNKYLISQYPDRYFAVSFDAAGGKFGGSYPVVYDSEAGIASLPAVERVGYIFQGWLLNGEVVESIPAGTTGELKLVASWKEDALVVDGTTEDGHFATLADALAAAKEGDTILILAGEYAGDATISISNLLIKGPNAGIDAVNGTRNPEAVIKGVWTLDAAAKNVTIDGLAFTGAAQIKGTASSATYEGLVFQNNKVYDTNASETAYDAWTRYALDAFLDFKLASGGKAAKFEILNNEFKNVDAVAVLVNRAESLVVDGNSFVDFGQDAVRVEGGYVGGVIAVTNNEFVQNTTEHGHVAFYLMSSSHQTLDTTVLVENNLFKQIGQAHTDVFTGAIAAGRFQEEKAVNWSIKGNVFDHCYDIMWLRNNGATSANFSCKVENNQFLGLPHNYYYGSYRGSDSESTNPHLTVFGANYYEDNEGNVIADLSAHAEMFKHLASYGTALAEKPANGEVETVKFYTISYDLNGGKTYETFVKEYNSLNDAPIALPTLEKANHNFNGWLLNGELVSEIPANAKGDLYLVADFTVLEGEIYTIEFEPNKENPIWPSRAANNREEIIAELYADLYEWAQGNGETRSYDEYVAYIEAELKAYNDIKLRNTELGNYPAEDGSTEYFFNVPKYYQKWKGFFEVFNTAMLAVNSGQVFYTDTYAAMVRLYQFISWSNTGQGYFNGHLSKMCAATQVAKEIPDSYRGGQAFELPQLALKNGLAFLGWYDNPEFTGEAITSIVSTDTGNKKFYAKWEAEIVPTVFTVNQISELLLFTTHQLEWTLAPENATNKEIEFFTSDESIVSVSAKGLLTAHANGKATITIKVYGNRELDLVFDVVVYTNDIIEASFEGESYAVVGETLQINANVVRKDGSTADVKWEALTPEIATVNEDGTVTAKSAGIAKIVASDPTNAELKVEFLVTVLSEEASGIAKFLLDSHESNVFSQYNLGIGSGIPVYYKDIFGSVSKLLMTREYQVDDSLKNKEKEANTGDYFDPITSIEFITVHYTGNMSSGADAEANAKYFVGDNAVSIHYCTGNDGIFQALTHDLGGYHAGDSGAMDVVGAFKWIPSGVKVAEGDPMYPDFSISTDFYYEINGQKTTIPMPRPWNYSGRGTDHTLNADGTISSHAGFGQSGFANREPESFMNDMALPFKIVDGEYYMGTTWWCYTQVYEGRICSTGGNRNSLGIESCVDKGSDLWLTWQITAQLVARLMTQYGLDITRVRGHHFFTAKDCPQPMLENNLCIWWKFLELVEAERTLLTEYSDYEITFESHNPEIVDNYGRIIAQPSETTCVSYTVTFSKDGQSESITLSSVINGLYVGR